MPPESVKTEIIKDAGTTITTRKNKSEGTPAIADPTPTGPTSKPNHVHNFHFLRQDVFPVSLLTGEPHPVDVFNPEKDPTPMPTIGHAVRYIRRISESMVELPVVPPKKDIKNPKVAATVEERRDAIKQERRRLRTNAPLRTEFRMHIQEVRSTLGEIKSYMDVKTTGEIFEKFRTMTGAERSALRKRINEMFLDNAGIPYDYETQWPAGIIREFAQQADNFWAKTRQNGGVLSGIGDVIDLPEDVKERDDILSLIESMFTSEDPEVKYRAGLKLHSMKLRRNIFAWREKNKVIQEALNNAQSVNRSKSVEGERTTFVNFLIDNVWEGGSDATITYATVHDTTDKDDYSVVEVREFPNDQFAEERKKRDSNNQNPKNNKVRIHTLPVRTTTFRGQSIQAHITDRGIKDDDSIFIKMMRTGEMDPEKIIKDDQGAILIARNVGQARKLLDRIREASRKSGKQIEIYDVEDNLDGSTTRDTLNPVSDPDMRVLKVRLQFDGENYEVMIHTLQTDADYKLRDRTGHGEYAIRRWFGSGRIYTHHVPDEIYQKKVVEPYGTADEVHDMLVSTHRASKRAGFI